MCSYFFAHKKNSSTVDEFFIGFILSIFTRKGNEQLERSGSTLEYLVKVRLISQSFLSSLFPPKNFVRFGLVIVFYMVKVNLSYVSSICNVSVMLR